MLLDQIREPNDIRKIPPEEYENLAAEIRTFLLDAVSQTGGHIAANLGVVELTMALHLFLHFPEDQLIWDVGHQSYVHKILTGRKDRFDTLRQFGGLSGFPKSSESSCDAFNTGHSSTSISAALGLAHARDLTGGTQRIACVIGDGAMTGGLAYEALNNASALKSNLLIIYNDNEMSISRNVGSLSRNLSRLRTDRRYQGMKDSIEHSLEANPVGKHIASGLRRTKNGIKTIIVPEMFFEDMGITYVGPVDGYDIPGMVKMFESASRVDGAVLIHVKTKKGKGYAPAEQHPDRFHGVGPFDVETGQEKNNAHSARYQDVFSRTIRRLAEEDERIVAITAAMADGTGLARFRKLYPKRFFDVGIAEGHAVTFAAGLAKGGLKPVAAIYSSFLQRAYDQITHDVCLQNLPVVFAIDRAGLVGADGDTHHGLFDIAMLRDVPNLTVMAPKNRWEMEDMFRFAMQQDGPCAIRYPRGPAYDGLKTRRAPIEKGKAEMLYEESGIALAAYGSMVKVAVEVRTALKEMGYACTLVNLRFAAPIDTDLIRRLSENHALIVTMEEGILSGGISEAVSRFAASGKLPCRVMAVGIPDRFVPHGSTRELFTLCGIDAGSVTERILEAIQAQELDMETGE